MGGICICICTLYVWDLSQQDILCLDKIPHSHAPARDKAQESALLCEIINITEFWIKYKS